MEARGKTIEQWFSMIQQGQIVLPRFQRHEAWRHSQIEGLLENILRKPSLPIGALLVLEVGDREMFYSRPIVGAPEPTGRPLMHLLDGQQRMTALWRALTDDYDDLTLFVSLASHTSPEEPEAGEIGSDAPEIHLEKRWPHKGVRRPVWADDDADVFRRGLIPAKCLCPGQVGERRLEAFATSVSASGQSATSLMMRIYDLRQRVLGYVIPFLSLPVGTGRETALDVFIKMNTSASPLRDFDIVVAQLEEAMGVSLHEKIDDLLKLEPGFAAYGDVEDNVLAIAALLSGKPALKKTYLDDSFGKELGVLWPKICDGVKRGVSFLRSEGILGAKTLPSEVAVYLVCALWANVPEHGYDSEGNARTLIRKALWRACCTDRYGKTATTRAFADYRTLLQMVAGATDGQSPELFDEENYKLPEIGELVASGWPARKDRLPRSILAISLRHGGLDFADGAPISLDNIDHREYHHLFPRATFPETAGDSYVNRALNCALITWRTNRKISANTPKAYIAARAAAANLGEDEVRDRLTSHLIPYDALIAGDYESFLAARAQIVLTQMKALCDGQRPRGKFE